MPPEFRFVPDAAQAHPHKFPVHRLGDRLHDAGLSHAGGSHEAEDRALHVLLHPENRQILDDPLLHLLQAVMLPVQDFTGPVQVQVVLRHFAPGQVQNPVDIGFRNHILRTSGGDPAQPVDLFFAFRPGFLAQRGLLHPLPVSVLILRLVPFAQLRLNCPDLLPEIEILLIPFHLPADPVLDLLFRVRQIRFPDQHGADLLQPLLGIQLLQEVLLLPPLLQDVGGQQVRDLPGLLQVADAFHHLLAHPLAAFGIFLKKVLGRPHQRLALVAAGHLVPVQQDPGQQILVLLQHLFDGSPALALHQNPDVLPGQVHHLPDRRHRAHGAELIRPGFLGFLVLLGHQEYLLIRRHALLQRGDAPGPPDIKMQRHAREKHHAAQRQHRQLHRPLYCHGFLLV